MNGGMSFEQALKARLDIIKPSSKIFADFNQANPPKLSKNISSLIEKLHNKGIIVYLVSGGFHAVLILTLTIFALTHIDS